MKILTVERAVELFHYNPKTGDLTRKINSGAHGRAGAVVGYTDSSGYYQVGIDTRSFLVHRVIYLIMTGIWPQEDVDHINHNRKDNRWSNLRPATRAQNSRNRKRPSNNRSGVIGVYWDKGRSMWRAVIAFNGKNICLGRFADITCAVQARKDAEKKYGYHTNHGRPFDEFTVMEDETAIFNSEHGRV